MQLLLFLNTFAAKNNGLFSGNYNHLNAMDNNHLTQDASSKSP